MLEDAQAEFVGRGGRVPQHRDAEACRRGARSRPLRGRCRTSGRSGEGRRACATTTRCREPATSYARLVGVPVVDGRGRQPGLGLRRAGRRLAARRRAKCSRRRATSPASCSRSSRRPGAACGARGAARALADAVTPRRPPWSPSPPCSRLTVASPTSRDSRMPAGQQEPHPAGHHPGRRLASDRRFALRVHGRGGYKWLLSPRGTAYFTVRPEHMDEVVPHTAGWYAGHLPWESIYGTPLRLADDARRFDVSPAWHCWVGAQPRRAARRARPGHAPLPRHGLANRFRAPSTCLRALGDRVARRPRRRRAGDAADPPSSDRSAPAGCGWRSTCTTPPRTTDRDRPGPARPRRRCAGSCRAEEGLESPCGSAARPSRPRSR